MTICLTLSHCGLLIRRIKSDLLIAIIKWSQLAPIKPHGSRASIQSSAKFSAPFAHHSLPWFIFLKPIKYVSYQVELNFLVYISLRYSASIDFAVTLKYHTGLLKPFSLAVVLLMKIKQNKTKKHNTLNLLTHAESDTCTFSNNTHIQTLVANINQQQLSIWLIYNDVLIE